MQSSTSSIYFARAKLSDFHDIEHFSEVAVVAASRRKTIPWLECMWVNLIPRVIG